MKIALILIIFTTNLVAAQPLDESDCSQRNEISGLCEICIPEKALYQGSCVDQCPENYYAINSTKTLECRQINGSFIFSNHSLTWFSDYSIRNYNENDPDVYLIKFSNELRGLSLCFWMKSETPQSETERRNVFSIKKGRDWYKPEKKNTSNFLSILVSLRIEFQCQNNSLIRPFMHDRSWFRMCIYLESQSCFLSVNTGLVVSCKELAIPELEGLADDYYIYIGGIDDNLNTFPVKISYASLSFFSKKEESNIITGEGIENISRLYKYHKSEDLSYQMKDIITGNLIPIIGDTYNFYGRVFFNESGRIRIPVTIKEGVQTIRFHKDFMFPTNSRLFSCGYIGLYDGNDESILQFNILPYISSEKISFSAYILGVGLNQYNLNITQGEEIIVLAKFENELILLVNNHYTRMNASNVTDLFLQIGAQLDASGKNSCPFSIDNLMIISGGWGQYHVSDDGNCLIRESSHDQCIRYSNFSTDYTTFSPSKPCKENCVECEDDFCLKCSESYFSLHGNCVKECPIGYKSTNQICNFFSVFCADPECKTCIEGFYLDGKLCRKYCESGYFSYWDSTSKMFKCQACDTENCIDCPENICTRCSPSFYLYQNNCLESCPTQAQFAYKGKCFSCHQPCAKCSEFGTCEVCPNGLYKYKEFCLEACPSRTFPYLILDECIEYPAHCEVPTAPDYCLICEEGFYLLDKRCVSNCIPPKPYRLDLECVDQCPSGFKYDETLTCIRECPKGTFSQHQKCVKCFKGCDTCYDANSCAACSDSKFVERDLTNSFFDCRENCWDEGPLRCSKCPIGCDKCLANFYGLECLSCNQDYTVSAKLDSGVCHILKRSAISYMQDLRTQMKVKFLETTSFISNFVYRYPFATLCDKNCAICKKGVCTSCKEHHYLNPSGSCTTECPIGYFKDSDSKICGKCHVDCYSCSSFFECTSCLSRHPRSIALTESGKCTSNEPGHYRKGLNSYKLHLEVSMSEKLQFMKEYKWAACPSLGNTDCEQCREDIQSHCGSYNRTFCTQCEFITDCDGACETCYRNKTCHSCPKDYPDLILKDNSCSCNVSKPYLDHISKRCVHECPKGSYIISETKECVANCFYESIFDNQIRAYKFQNICLKECPAGTQPIVYYGLFNNISCEPILTYSKISEIKYYIDKLGTNLTIPEAQDSKCDLDVQQILKLEEYFEEIAQTDYLEIMYNNDFLTWVNHYFLCKSSLTDKDLVIFANSLHAISPLCFNLNHGMMFSSIPLKLIT